MSRSVALAAILSLGAVGSDGYAAQPYVDIERRLTPEQRHATGLDTLSDSQLELLNRLLREGAPVEPSAVATPVAAPVIAKESAPTAAEIGAGPIKSRVNGALDGWEPGSVFELDNGQRWQVLKGSVKLREPRQSPEVMLIRGFAGRWFLQIDENLPKALVEPID